MVKSINSIGSLKSDTLKNIIKDIYYNHYLNWYKNFIHGEELKRYEKHIDEQFNKVQNSIKGESTILLQESLAGVCEHYCSS